MRGSLFGPDEPRFTGKICYRSVVPVVAVPGGPPPNDNVQWLGPHGAIVLYPVRRDELINVVCHYDDEGYRHESWVTRCEREEVLERYSGWHESRPAAWRRDLTIAWRRRMNRRDPEGRGAAWLADYDASAPDVLA